MQVNVKLFLKSDSENTYCSSNSVEFSFSKECSTVDLTLDGRTISVDKEELKSMVEIM